MTREHVSSGAVWLCAAWLGACSLLVSSEPEPLRCSDEGQNGPPACDEGQVCEAGICRSASNSPSGLGSGTSEGGAGGGSGNGPTEGDSERRQD